MRSCSSARTFSWLVSRKSRVDRTVTSPLATTRNTSDPGVSTAAGLVSFQAEVVRQMRTSTGPTTVLFVVGQLKGGGLERQLRYLAPRFRSCGSQIVVWNYSGADR